MIKLILLFNIVLIYCFNLSSIFKEYHCIELNKTNISDLLNISYLTINIYKHKDNISNLLNNSYSTINICKHKDNLICIHHNL